MADLLAALPDFAIPFLVAAHLCQTTGDLDFCRIAIEQAKRPEFAIYVEHAETLRRMQ